MEKRVIGIMGAMMEEIEGIIHLLKNRKEEVYGQRTFYSGQINRIEVVVVFSRWGKVAAATTVTTLIQKFQITELIFTGVAGAIQSHLKIGDIVIAEKLIQHDLDGRPLIQQFEIPLLQKSYISSDAEKLKQATLAVQDLLEASHLKGAIKDNDLDRFDIHAPQYHVGNIASGDQFFSNQRQKDQLLDNLPDILCVEMEGAAVAQVCYEHGLPFVVIRTISDSADAQAEFDFTQFIAAVSSKYSVEIIKAYCAN